PWRQSVIVFRVATEVQHAPDSVEMEFVARLQDGVRGFSFGGPFRKVSVGEGLDGETDQSTAWHFAQLWTEDVDGHLPTFSNGFGVGEVAHADDFGIIFVEPTAESDILVLVEAGKAMRQESNGCRSHFRKLLLDEIMVSFRVTIIKWRGLEDLSRR